MPWIARDKGGDKSYYCISRGMLVDSSDLGPRRVDWRGENNGHFVFVCPEDFHKAVSNFRLKPGEGPVEIEGFEVVMKKRVAGKGKRKAVAEESRPRRRP